MGCASSGDVTAAKDEVIMAVEDCCDELVELYMSTAMNVGQGLDLCCQAWDKVMTAQSIGGTVTAPAIPGPPDADGNPTVAVPAKTINAGNTWASLAAAQWAHQCQAEMHATNTYNNQYNAWLASYEKWQDLQIIPQLVAFGLQVVALTKMYEQWTNYLKKTNKIMCGLADEVFPCAKANYLAIKGDFNAHITKYQEMVCGAEGEEITSYSDKVAWHCELGSDLLDCWENDGDGQIGYKVLSAQHTQNMAQNLSNVAEAGQWAVQDAKACLQKYKADIDNNFTNWGAENYEDLAEQTEVLYKKAGNICAWLNDCGQALTGEWDDKKDQMYAALCDEIGYGSDCINEIMNVINQAAECMDQQKALYDNYHGSIETFAPTVIDEANSLLTGTTMAECQQYAQACAEKFKSKYEIIYEPNEDALAQKILEMACRLAEGTENCHEFQKDLSALCLAHWEDHYADCDAELAEGIMAEAKLLYDTRKDTFDEFVLENGKLWDFWCNHYQALENDFSDTTITKATDQVCHWYDAMQKMCDEACSLLDFWKAKYQGEECITAPKIIQAGVEACEQQIETYNKLDQMLDDLCAKWFNDVCQCELTDIAELCKLHEKAEVACEIDDNAQCVQDIAVALKECYLNIGLGCEKEYLAELCALPEYKAKYCDLEDRALLHIRSNFDKARENLLRNSNRYCVGDTEWQLCKLETEQARLEAQAIESANRFERWWEVQEQDRRHRYKMDMVQIYQGFAAMAIEGFSNTTQQYDMILTQIHNRLSRSYNMLSQANQSGSTVANSTAQGVNQALSSIQNGQHYTDMFYRMKAEFNQSSNNLAARAQEQTRIGQQYATLAQNALNSAENVASTAITQAYQQQEHGYRFKDMALQASRAADKTALDAQQLGLNYVDRGHFHIQESRQWKSLDWQIVCDTVQKAQSQVQLAQRTLDQAFQFEQHRDALMQRCRDNGMDAQRHHFDMFNAGVGKVERAMTASENGIRAAFEMINWGQEQRNRFITQGYNLGTLVPTSVNAFNGIKAQGLSMLSLAAQQNQLGMQAKSQEFDNLCRMLQQREAQVCAKLLGFNAVGQGTSALANMFGQGTANAAEGLIGSIGAFAGQPPSILNGAPGPGGANNAVSFPVYGQGSQNSFGLGTFNPFSGGGGF